MLLKALPMVRFYMINGKSNGEVYKLIDKASITKKIAGKKVIHHSPENKKLLPNLIKVPKEGFVGGKPTPKKLRVDSVIIACDSPIVAITNTGLKIFGSICLNIITIFEWPIILEAKIYSLFFSTRVAALVTLANCGHSEIPIANIRTYIAISS